MEPIIIARAVVQMDNFTLFLKALIKAALAKNLRYHWRENPLGGKTR